jgi:Ser/Thr protein kinase RdoA (MazF antagonist)
MLPVLIPDAAFATQGPALRQICSATLGSRSRDGRPHGLSHDVCLENVVFRDGDAVALVDLTSLLPGAVIADLSAALGSAG